MSRHTDRHQFRYGNGMTDNIFLFFANLGVTDHQVHFLILSFFTPRESGKKENLQALHKRVSDKE